MDYRMRKALLALRIVIRKTSFITDPNLINFFILAGHHTLNSNIAALLGIASRVQGCIASHRALRADRSLHVQFPGTRFEAEVTRRQRADGTDIRSVA